MYGSGDDVEYFPFGFAVLQGSSTIRMAFGTRRGEGEAVYLLAALTQGYDGNAALLDQGEDIRDVQALLGHKHVTVTQVYDATSAVVERRTALLTGSRCNGSPEVNPSSHRLVALPGPAILVCQVLVATGYFRKQASDACVLEFSHFRF